MLTRLTESQRLRLLVANLLLVGLCIGGLALLILVYPAAFGPAAPATATQANTPRPSFTPSQTLPAAPLPTLTRTPFPSLTATPPPFASPTGTASATPFPPGLPTLTPARAPVNADGLELHPWTADHADYAAHLLHSYPEWLPAAARERGSSAYYLASRYPIVAWKEALLRFPAAPQAGNWRWGLAFDLMRYGSQEAAVQYAFLIAGALNSGETDLTYLYNWLPQREPQLSLVMTAIDPPDGFLGAYVIELHSAGGSAFIWLLQSPGVYQAYPLLARFDFAGELQSNWLAAELDGDPQNGQEIAVYFSSSPGGQVDAPQVFNLGQLPPRPLPFYPQQAALKLGMEFDNRWRVQALPSGQNELVFDTRVYPPCPVQVQAAYRWNGVMFAPTGQSFSLAAPGSASFTDCQAVLEHAQAVWGPQAAIDLVEPLLEQGFPERNLAGEPYPPDEADAWKLRLGINYALLGDPDGARHYLNQVSTQPSVYNSRWIEPAQVFLGAYTGPQELYRACTLVTECDPVEALRHLAAQTPPEQDAFLALRAAGLNPSASGYYDFDGDDDSERWFTTRYRPRTINDFWILARTAGGWQALRVDSVETIPPSLELLTADFIADEGLDLQPVTFLESRRAFSLQRAPLSLQPYLAAVPLRQEYPSRFFLPLQAIEAGLFNGADPQQVQQDLLHLQEWPGLLCAPTWTCDSYYYLLGLSSELAGDSEQAVAAYIKLWQDYSQSPFTVLARLKLVGVGEDATPTPTLTPSAPAGAGTLTASPTLVPGVTPSPTGSVTPNISATPTVTGTPPTPTFTPTLAPALSGTPSPPVTPSATATDGESYPTPPPTVSYP
ncbi:MAG: tetratricopeptide repeat protein [Chloroflexota bacterium]